MNRTFLLTVFALSLLMFSCSENKNAKLAFFSENVILPDNSTIFWGGVTQNDTIYLSKYNDLPILKNVSDIFIDTLLLCVTIDNLKDTSSISQYYLKDYIKFNTETRTYTARLRYAFNSLRPFQEIPFPITLLQRTELNNKIQNADNLKYAIPFHLRYDFYYNIKSSQKGVIVRNINLVGFLFDKRSKRNLQKDFLDISRRLINWRKNGKNSFIFNDTIVGEIKNYDLLKGENLIIEKIKDLE